jgi:hypothetical protein
MPEREKLMIKNLSLRRATVSILTIALIVTSLFVLPITTQSEQAYATDDNVYTGYWEGNKAPTPLQPDEDPSISDQNSLGVPSTYAWPYPWSRNEEATGDWVADSYGLTTAQSAKFEPVTVDRLADVLSRDGESHYIIFATPRSKAGQNLVKAVAQKAVANNVKKIYLFNPLIDDYQLDIYNTGEIGAIAGSNHGQNIQGIDAATKASTINNIWLYIKGAYLANKGVQNTTAAPGNPYNAVDFGTLTNGKNQAVFFTTSQDTTDVDTYGASNPSDPLTSYKTIAAGTIATKNTQINDELLNPIFSAITESDEVTDFDFFRRVWNATTRGSVPGDIKNDENFNIFSTQAEWNSLWNGENATTYRGQSSVETSYVTYTKDNFPLQAIDYVEGWDRLNYALNSKTWLNYGFAAAGCTNSKAVIGTWAAEAKKANEIVYVNDNSLDGSGRLKQTVEFATSSAAAAVYDSTNNSWMSSRQNNLPKIAYLLGHTQEYFGDSVTSEYDTDRGSGNTQNYYYNGDFSDSANLTATRPGYSGYNAEALAVAPAGNAYRDQIPFFLPFNGDTVVAAGHNLDGTVKYAPIDRLIKWIDPFTKNAVGTSDNGRFTDYMLSLSSVLSVTQPNALHVRGIEHFKNTIAHIPTLFEEDLFYQTPTPSIEGTVKVGHTVSLQTEAWPQPRGTAAGSKNVDIPKVEIYDDSNLLTIASTVKPFDITNYVYYANSQKISVPHITGNVTISGTVGVTPALEASITLTDVVGLPYGHVLKTTPSFNSNNLRIAVASKSQGVTDLTATWKADGTVVKTGAVDAGNAEYVIAPADAGKNLTVEVKGVNSNNIYQYAVQTSVAQTVASSEFTSVPTPTISGTAKNGQTLTAVAGSWDAGTSLAYQWYADGVAISGATASSLVLTSAQTGKVITVSVTGSKAGYTSQTKTSIATTKVVISDEEAAAEKAAADKAAADKAAAEKAAAEKAAAEQKLQGDDIAAKAAAAKVAKAEKAAQNVVAKTTPAVTAKTAVVGKKKATITFPKVKNATKYTIRYKIKGSKKWTTKTISAKAYKTYTLTLKKLKAGKKYQYQINYTKKVAGKNITTKWSKVKTTKKVKK